MQYRPFGKTGFSVSALGLGAMRLPGTPFMPGSVDMKKAITLIRHAVDSGINYIDTAYFYHLGASERAIGRALKDGFRDKVHLTTKLPMILVRKPDDFERFLDEQLARLQVERIDTYLFHALNAKSFQMVKDFGFIERMEKARSAGKIGNIGFSFHDTLPVFREIVDYYPWDVTQIQYNYLDTGIQATTVGLEYAHSKGMAVVIMEPLKGGTLVTPPAEALAIMKKSAKRRTPVEWALQFLWDRKEVATVLSGMGTRRMVDENCGYADTSGVGSLDSADRETLTALVDCFRRQILVPCTACGYCMPCPFGVNIPENFAILNYSNTTPRNLIDHYFRFTYSRLKYGRLARNGQTVNRDKPNGASSLCRSCGQCAPKCPQGIDIPGDLSRAVAVMERGKPASETFGLR